MRYRCIYWLISRFWNRRRNAKSQNPKSTLHQHRLSALSDLPERSTKVKLLLLVVMLALPLPNSYWLRQYPCRAFICRFLAFLRFGSVVLHFWLKSLKSLIKRFTEPYVVFALFWSAIFVGYWHFGCFWFGKFPIWSFLSVCDIFAWSASGRKCLFAFSGTEGGYCPS